MKSVSLGALAGLGGAGIWAGIAHSTGYEVGWIAWGIGALVGVTVRFASRPEVSYTGDEAEDALRELRAESGQLGPGILAAAIAIVSVLAGKYVAVMLLIGHLSASEFEEETLISYVADSVVAEYTAEGRAVQWPEGVHPQYATAQSDYPGDVWAEASRRWQEMSPEERAAYGEATAAMVSAMIGQNASGAWLATFGMMDLLWFGLAAWTAFKIGASGSEE